jgi:D-arabinose 1-dehydrogenase-like Zn-dependent alcohol dehydrogenase
LVTGAGGGVASLAVTFAIALGAETWVTSGRDEIVEAAKTSGAVGGANYGSPEWWKTLPGHFDLIVDGAGGSEFGRLIRLLGMSGHLVFYGGTNGKWPEISPQHLFFKQAKIVGSTMGSPEEFVAMMKCVSENRLLPTIDSQWPLSGIEAAMQRLVSPQRQGKVVVKVN